MSRKQKDWDQADGMNQAAACTAKVTLVKCSNLLFVMRQTSAVEQVPRQGVNNGLSDCENFLRET